MGSASFRAARIEYDFMFPRRKPNAEVRRSVQKGTTAAENSNWIKVAKVAAAMCQCAMSWHFRFQPGYTFPKVASEISIRLSLTNEVHGVGPPQEKSQCSDPTGSDNSRQNYFSVLGFV